MIQCKEVIIAEITKGDGELSNPFRKVTQVFEKDGTFIAEKDDYAEDRFTMDDLLKFSIFCKHKGVTIIDMQDLEDWIKEER